MRLSINLCVQAVQLQLVLKRGVTNVGKEAGRGVESRCGRSAYTSVLSHFR